MMLTPGRSSDSFCASIADVIERSPNALKVRDLTKKLGVSDQTIYRMIDDHTIPYFRVRGAIRFDPQLPPATRSAIDDLTMGTVARIGLEFDEPFWVSHRFASNVGDERLDTMSFLHGTSDVAYPIWWTTYPVRSPLLIGWCGGPKALSLFL